MNCREARTMLPFLDGCELDPAERREVTAHADGCAACATELARVRESVDLLKVGAADLLSDAPSAEELERMLAGAEPDGRRRLPWIPLAAAAVVLLAAIPVALHLLDRPEETVPAEKRAAQEEPEEQPEPEPELEEKPVEKKVAESPELLFKTAIFLKNTREWKKAEERFREVIDASTTKEDRRKYAIPARMQIAECLYRREKFRRSYEEYERVVAEHRDEAPDTAADAAYYRYRAATALAMKTKAPADLELKRKARDAFRRGFPDHPRAMDLSYYTGADLASTADVEMISGKTAEARKRYEEAISDGFALVRPKSVLWAKAQARMVEMYYRLGRHAEAVSLAMDVMSEKGWQKTTDPRRLDNRKQAKALAAYHAARALAKEKEWKEALRFLEPFEEDSKERTIRVFLPVVRIQRMRALLALERIDEAVAQAKLILATAETWHPKTRKKIHAKATKLLAAATGAETDEEARRALTELLGLLTTTTMTIRDAKVKDR